MVVVSLSQSGLVEFVWCFSRVFVAIFCMFSVFFDDRNVSGGADSSCFYIGRMYLHDNLHVFAEVITMSCYIISNPGRRTKKHLEFKLSHQRKTGLNHSGQAWNR